jgi:hypothetical protein
VVETGVDPVTFRFRRYRAGFERTDTNRKERSSCGFVGSVNGCERLRSAADAGWTRDGASERSFSRALEQPTPARFLDPVVHVDRAYAVPVGDLRCRPMRPGIPIPIERRDVLVERIPVRLVLGYLEAHWFAGEFELAGRVDGRRITAPLHESLDPRFDASHSAGVKVLADESASRFARGRVVVVVIVGRVIEEPLDLPSELLE